MRRPVRIEKVKRPRGVFEFDMDHFDTDDAGIWLGYTKGATWRAPHDQGTMPVDAILLLRPDDPFVTWWVDDPQDRRVGIDICLPPVRTPDGWSFVDLELDPVRHESTGVIEIEDDDEFREACAAGWIDERDAALASATAADRADALRRRDEPWGEVGWRKLAELLAERRSTPPDDR